jgi:hypothetical protein
MHVPKEITVIEYRTLRPFDGNVLIIVLVILSIRVRFCITIGIATVNRQVLASLSPPFPSPEGNVLNPGP